MRGVRGVPALLRRALELLRTRGLDIPLIIVSGTAVMFTGNQPSSTLRSLQGIATAPEFLWELFLGLYCTFKGFKSGIWLIGSTGKGNVVEMRGIAGVPADTDRHTGFRQALKKYPGIKVVKSTFMNWDFATSGKQMLDILNSGVKVDGVWTSGIDYTIVNAFQNEIGPRNGARMVARAWVDPEFKRRLLEDATEVDVDAIRDHTGAVVGAISASTPTSSPLETFMRGW